MQRSDAHLRPARASPPALRRGGTMSQRRRGERRSSKQAKVHGERPARRGGPGGVACGGMEQLQETSWSVAVSRKISSPANGGTATRSGQGKKPNRGGSARGRATTPPGQNAKPSRRGSLGGGISGRGGTACRAPASSGHAQASSVRGVRPRSAGTHTEDSTKLTAGSARPAALPLSRPEGGTGPSVPRDSDTALSCGLLRSVNVATAAHLLGVSRRSVQYMLEDGRLEGTRIPPRGWWRISRASLARLIPLDRVQ